MGITKFSEKKQFIKCIWFVAIIIVWEFIVSMKWVNPLLMPSLRTVLKALFAGLWDGSLFLQLQQSITMVVGGLLIGTITALIMVYLDYFYLPFQSLFELLSSMLHPLPGIALLPIVILWTGIGKTTVLMIIIHAVLWSLYLNIKMGFAAVDPPLIEAAKNNGAGNLQLFRYVLLPCSIREIMGGIQIGWSRGWRALISAEMIFGAISSVGGLGWYIYERRAFMDTAGMFAGIILVILVGLVVEHFVFTYLTQKITDRF